MGPAVLGLLIALGGLLIAGPLGGAAGLLAGVAAARWTLAVLLAAAAALFAAAALTVFERPLSEFAIYGFPQDHSLANSAGAIAAVLLLAGLAGLIVHGLHASEPRPPAEDPTAGATKRVPTETIAAILAVALFAAAVLWRIGDRTWEAPALAVAVITALGLAGLLRIGRLRWM